MSAAADGEFKLSSLISNIGEDTLDVERSEDNHFMYYSLPKQGAQARAAYLDWKPPQELVPVTFAEFLGRAEEAEKGADLAGDKSLYYLVFSATEVSSDGYRYRQCR